MHRELKSNKLNSFKLHVISTRKPLLQNYYKNHCKSSETKLFTLVLLKQHVSAGNMLFKWY